MNDLLWWLAQNTIIVALLVPPVLLACWMLRHRPAVQHLLWVVVLLKLVTPPVVVWPWSVAELRGAVSDATLHEPSAEVALAQPSPEVFAPVPLETAANLPANAVPSAKNWNFSILPWSIWGLGAIWFGGAVVTLVSQLRMIRCHARLIRRGTEPPRVLEERVASLAREIGVRSPRVVTVQGIHSPMVWCLGRLTLLWPESLSSPQDCQRLQSVIAHELAHLRRCDHWVAWLDLAARIAWWWNPLYWFVSRRVCESAEMACDAMAIAAGDHKRGDYAKLLLELSTNFQTATPVSILGVGTSNAASFERRLAMILSERVSGGRPLWGAVVAVALAMGALPAWSLAQQKEADKANQDANSNEPATDKGNAADAEATVTIAGKVVDDQGQPIAGAQVWWLPRRRPHTAVQIRTTTSDETGAFSFSQPENDLYFYGQLWVLGKDKQVAVVTVYRYDGAIRFARQKRPGDGQRSVDEQLPDSIIRLEPASESVFRILAPDDSPVVDVEVEPTHITTTVGHDLVPDPLRALLRVKTDEGGRARIRGIEPAWLYSIEIRSEMFGIQPRDLHNIPNESQERAIHLRRPGKIMGQLHADDPQWTRGVTLYFDTSAGTASATTDEHGRFVVPTIAEGTLGIQYYPGKEVPVLPRLPVGLLVRPDGITVMDIKLEMPIIVRGAIRAQDTNKPVAGAEIMVKYGVFYQCEYVLSDAKGNFEARVLPGDISFNVAARPREFDDYHQVGELFKDKIVIGARQSPVDVEPIFIAPNKPESEKASN